MAYPAKTGDPLQTEAGVFYQEQYAPVLPSYHSALLRQAKRPGKGAHYPYYTARLLTRQPSESLFPFSSQLNGNHFHAASPVEHCKPYPQCLQFRQPCEFDATNV
jgi:hypothetical protein